MTAPIRSMPAPDAILATVRNQDDLVEAFRAVKAMLGMTNSQLDDLANLTEGHTDKLLGPTQTKSISPLTFNAFCWAFAVKFEMKIDIEQAKLMAEHWEDRKRKRPVEYSENSRVSAKIIERAKPSVLKEFAALGGAARHAQLTSMQSISIARKAAKKSSRTKNLDPARRKEIAKAAATARWHKPVVIFDPPDPLAEQPLKAVSD